ncbi:mast cell protease 3-like [Epargyreus clarus]|uniref:mast cell protease 3-like n=1 Tax=Epargyreus clarus TaxID=520877 RepID=UPI003C2DD62A
MKAFAVVLLCFFAAVHGRSTGVQVRTAAALGENPWVVHIRTAVSTSGLLNSCTGTLIDSSWVLTSANCLRDARFVWIRYGAIDVTRPELVTESGAGPITFHPEFNPETGANDIAVINTNRFVQPTDNVSPVVLAGADDEVPSAGQFCGFGAGDDSSVPGETLNCYEVTVEESDGSLVASSDEGAATQFDIGAALVSDGVQYGVLVGYPGDDDTTAASFLSLSAYKEWIASVTGIGAADAGFGSDVMVVN